LVRISGIPLWNLFLFFFMKTQQEFSIEWGGRMLTIGTGLLAQQANGSCTVRSAEPVDAGAD
jgi:hypothetical protein